MARTTKPTDAPKPVYSLPPRTRQSLARSISYHQAMSDDLKDSNGKLSEMHAEVCAQLQEILDNALVMTGIDVAVARQTIRRTIH